MAAVEFDFLPAALEIQERPPLAASRFIIWTIVSFLILAVVWACIGEVNIVAVATGKTVPSGHVKTIQSFEPGVVRRIHVSDGDYVRAGEVLIELDSTESSANLKRLQSEAEALALNRIRLEALISAIDRDGAEQSVDWGDASADKRRIQRRHYREQLREYRSRVAVLVSARNEKRAAAQAIAARIAQLDTTIPIVKEHSAALQNLVSKQAAARLDWLQLERESIEQSKEREVQHYRLAEVRAALDSLEEQERQLVAEHRQRWTAELVDVDVRLDSLGQEIIKAQQRQELRSLTAPVTGRVQQLSVHTVGGVVTPAQALMLLVPEDEPLEVEAYIKNKDIGFVREGQSAEVKFETFPFTKYGTVAGTITTISRDARQDDVLGLVYLARVKLDRAAMPVGEREVYLSPGMAVAVEARTGRRRLIEFLLSPLLRYKNESVRER